MPATTRYLEDAAGASLRAFFNTQHHHPSPEHWDALDEVIRTMARMAEGVCDPKVFVAALDPGIGKSSAVLEFAKALMASPGHREVGMIVCVGRISEAVKMATALRGHPSASVAVVTSKDDANALSTVEDPSEAQVLVTTQQRLERAADGGRAFADMTAFHYRGAPRRVRVWDEAWLPGVPVTIASDDIMLLLKPVRRLSSGCADALSAFAASLSGLKDGEVVDVPDFAVSHGVSFHQVLIDLQGGAGGLRDDQQRAASALASLCGRTARVRHDGQTGCTVLSYRDTLPPDLAPLLVLDASARVRKTYEFVEGHRGGLVKLPVAVKDYSPLRVHTWDVAGGKSGWGKQGDYLLNGIVGTILERPDERWLVIHHMSGPRVPNIPAQVRRRLKDPRVAVEFLTWGQHMATNLYADFPNVVLAGTLFMKPSYYTALTHLAQGRDVAGGLASGDDIDAITHGEHANVVLQALCRGRVRKSDGAKCLPMNAYVIASKRSGIAGLLTTLFPGCEVMVWREAEKKIPDKLREALEVVRAAMDSGATSVSTTTIRHAIKVDRQNLPKLVTNRPEWVPSLAAMGMQFATGRGRAGAVRRVGVS